jgi:hypothetical protein
MEYDRFDELVTARHHIIVKNWPLKKFCNPSNITARIELEMLHNAWQSGVTYFQKLTRDEMEAWESDRFASRMEMIPPPPKIIPAPASTQPPAEMTLISDLSSQELSDVAPVLSLHTPPTVPLANVTNVSSVLASNPPAPDPDLIAKMIQADPALRNVDPALIAMGITGGDQHRVGATTTAAATTTTAPLTEQPANRGSQASKRRWQTVVTPLSFDVHAAKKPRKQRKDKRLQNPRGVQDSEN